MDLITGIKKLRVSDKVLNPEIYKKKVYTHPVTRVYLIFTLNTSVNTYLKHKNIITLVK